MSRTETNARYLDQMTARYGPESWQVELLSLYHYEVCRNIYPGVYRLTTDRIVRPAVTIVERMEEQAPLITPHAAGTLQTRSSRFKGSSARR